VFVALGLIAVVSAISARNAYNLAIRSSDEFLTDLADRLRRTPGVPKAEVEGLLKKGEKFLADLSDAVVDKQAIAHTTTRLFLKFAEVNIDRMNPAQARAQTLSAREKLLSGRAESDLSFEELALLGETYLIEGRSYDVDGNYKLAQETFDIAERQINNALVSEPKNSRFMLLAGTVQYWRGGMFWSLHDYENAMATAKKCLKIIEESDRTQFSYDTSALQAGCQNIVGLSADDIGDGNTARQYYELSARTIETIPKGERDMLVIKAYATAKNNIGWFEQNAGHYETARSFHQEAIDVYKKPLACDPENEAVRNKYASYLRGL
jgi:tetratricopeptide (TPR) repeat protein